MEFEIVTVADRRAEYFEDRDRNLNYPFVEDVESRRMHVWGDAQG